MIEILKALADENRMRIYNLLRIEERCVCEIEDILSITQSNASRHLNRLKNAKIIDYKKKSQWVYYQIDETFIAQHGLLYEYLNSQMARSEQCVKDVKNLQKYLQTNKIPCIQTKKNKISEGKLMKTKVAFICVHNSCRSQMAEAWAKKLGSDVLDVYSAGTEDYPEVKPLAVQVMEEVGVDMSKHSPKLLSDIPAEVDIVITMGCNVDCPYLPCKQREDWGLTDPSGGPIDDYIVTRDIIKGKVEKLIQQVKGNQ